MAGVPRKARAKGGSCPGLEAERPDWMKHTLAYFENDRVRLDYRDTHQHTLDAEEQDSFPPQERVY